MKNQISLFQGIRHIIWDWNGTLLDDAWLCVEIMNEILKKHGLPLMTETRYQDVFQFPVKSYYEKLGFDFSREPFEIPATEYIRNYEKRRFECSLQEGAPQILQCFHESGYTQSILTAYVHDSLVEILNHFSISHYFEKIIGLDNHYAHSKLENGLLLMKELPYPPDQILYIGDTLHDHEVAVAMDVYCLLITSGHSSKSRLKECGRPVFHSLKVLLEKFYPR